MVALNLNKTPSNIGLERENPRSIFDTHVHSSSCLHIFGPQFEVDIANFYFFFQIFFPFSHDSYKVKGTFDCWTLSMV